MIYLFMMMAIVFILVKFTIYLSDKQKLAINLLKVLLYLMFFESFLLNMVPQLAFIVKAIPEIIVFILVVCCTKINKYRINKITLWMSMFIIVSSISSLIILKIDFIQYVTSIRVYIRYILLYIIIRPMLNETYIREIKSTLFNLLCISLLAGITQLAFRDLFDSIFLANEKIISDVFGVINVGTQPDRNSIFYISGTLGRYNSYGPIMVILFSYLDFTGYLRYRLKNKANIIIISTLSIMCIFASYSRLAWILIGLYYLYKIYIKVNVNKKVIIYNAVLFSILLIILYILLGDITSQFEFELGQNAKFIDRILEVLNSNNYRLDYNNADGSHFRLWLLIMGTLHLIIEFPLNLIFGFGAGSFWIKNGMAYDIADKIDFNSYNAMAINDSAIFGAIGQYGLIAFLIIFIMYTYILKRSDKSTYVKYLKLVFVILTVFFNVFESNIELLMIITVILLESNIINKKNMY